MFINVSDVSAATTTDTTSVAKSADTVKKQVETKHTVPSTVTVGNKKVTSAQYLFLLTQSTTAINAKKKTVTVKTVAKPSKPSETVKSGTLTKKEYLSVASKLNTFISKNGRAPNYATTSLGKMRYENVIYTYSKILAFYKANGRLPNTVSVKPWKSASGEGKQLYSVNASTQSKIDAIGYAEAKFRRAQGNSNPTTMEKIGWGDCWASSSWLYNKLSNAGVAVRIVQCVGGSYPLHRWAQVNLGNGWVNWSYGKYNSKHIGAIGSGYSVKKTYSG